MRLLVLMLVYWFCAASPAGAQTKSVADLASYRGADREEVLKAGAKKEGKLVWYTSLTAHRDIANVFEAKYPGIKVETYRAGPNDLTRRLITEAQSKRSIADLIETTPATLMMMRENKMLTPYFSPHLRSFPEDAKEEADKGGCSGRRTANQLSAWATTATSFAPPTCRKILPIAQAGKQRQDRRQRRHHGRALCRRA